MSETIRCMAGIDVHKRMLAVVVRKEQDTKTEYAQRQFGTTRREIEHLAAYLRQEQVAEVVMESTAQYWRPVWYGLETHLKLHLCHPLLTRARRGRKRDFLDAKRLVDRLWGGDIEESFVPSAEQRSWRWMTRMRVALKDKVGVVRNEVEGLLEEAGIKLTGVVSDPFGVSGWAMLNHLAQGETDLEKIVSEARGTLRKKKTALQEAIAGPLPEACRFMLRQLIDQVALLRKQIADLSAAITAAMKEHIPTLHRLSKVPGLNVEAAEIMLAEIGPGAATFPSGGQMASWAGICPGSQESAGINYSRRSAKGNRYLRRLMAQVAWAAVRTKGTFFEDLFRRLKPRIEPKGAMWAVAHRITNLVWLMLQKGVEYQERGPRPPNPAAVLRKMRRLTSYLAAAGLDPSTLIPQILTPTT